MTRNYSLHSHYPGLELDTLFYHPTDISFSDQTPRNDPIAFQLRVDSYDQKSSQSLDLVFIWSFDEFPNLYLRFFTI